MRKNRFWINLGMLFIGIWIVFRFLMYGFDLRIFGYQNRMWQHMMPMGLFTMIGVWCFVIFIVLHLTKSPRESESISSSKLQDRLARGEITIEEYKKIMKIIREEEDLQ